MKVAIIEDEIPSARLLSLMVGRLRPQWQVDVLPGSVQEAAAWLESHDHPDIIFLDIQLSDGNSFDLLTKARPTSTIIFTTAYDEYAVRAFGVNSIDYILKPVDETRLLEAIIKYETLTKPSLSDQYLDTVIESLGHQPKRYRTRFLIAAPDQYRTLQVDQIAYFYSQNKITFAVENDGRHHTLDLPLEKLSQQLDPDKFFRANRQTILSIGSIRKIEPYFASKILVHTKPESPDKITISREKITAFKLWLNF